jgi:hypothetical protein
MKKQGEVGTLYVRVGVALIHTGSMNVFTSAAFRSFFAQIAYSTGFMQRFLVLS